MLQRHPQATLLAAVVSRVFSRGVYGSGPTLSSSIGRSVSSERFALHFTIEPLWVLTVCFVLFHGVLCGILLFSSSQPENNGN